jgi:putative ABC transport system substrate-binding protein
MNRRELISLIGGAAVVWPISTLAQEAGRTYRIAILSRSPRSAVNYVAFFDELRKLGFVEGQNLAVDTRGFAARSEQFPELAMELVKSNLDVLVCGADAAIRAAQQATQTIPILGTTDDMVGSGLHSLAKPGGNTTGMSILATELDGKRQEILMELLPDARRIGGETDCPVRLIGGNSHQLTMLPARPPKSRQPVASQRHGSVALHAAPVKATSPRNAP